MNIVYRVADKKDQKHIEGLNTISSDAALLEYAKLRKDILEFETYTRTGGNFWVAEDTDTKKIIGCVAVKFIEDDTAKVKALRVHPDYRKKGIATELMHILEDYCIKNGIQTIRLGVNNKTTAAVRLYESLGYKKISENTIAGEICSSSYTKQLR